jgi:arylsulfatase A-like enzyme
VLDNTLVIITGDHGETFWEHGDFWNHGLWLHQTTVHVPLLLAFPDGRGAGSVVDAPVTTVDLLPTLAELFRLPLPERAEGISLLGAVDGAALGARAIFSVATQPGALLESKEQVWTNAAKPHSVRKGPWKLVQAPYLDNFQQLFHVGRDPGERKNLLRSALGPAAQAALADLRADLKAFRAKANPLPSGFDRSQLEDTIRKLESLGYVQGGDPEEED